MSEQQYKYLTYKDTIQAGDEFWTGLAWFEYHEDCIGKFVYINPSRRPIANAIDQPQRERIAYEELQPGDVIQEGDEWQNADGRWHPLVLTPGASGQVRDGLRARRPHKISATLEIGDALAALKSAQRARDELQLQADELRVDRKDEPTARQVRDMLRTWATELDWSADCLGSATREQIDGVHNTLITVVERIDRMLNPEDSHDN